jgi:hypothetical protein
LKNQSKSKNQNVGNDATNLEPTYDSKRMFDFEKEIGGSFLGIYKQAPVRDLHAGMENTSATPFNTPYVVEIYRF